MCVCLPSPSVLLTIGPCYSFILFQATDIDRIRVALQSGKEKVREAQKRLALQNESLPELHQVYKDYKKQLADMESLSKIEEQVKDLKVQLVWRHHMDNQAKVGR